MITLKKTIYAILITCLASVTYAQAMNESLLISALRLNKTPTPNNSFEDNWLIKCVKENSIEGIDMPLNMRANVDSREEPAKYWNSRALHLAILNKNVQMVEKLLQLGANPDHLNPNEPYALHMSLYNIPPNIKIAKLLLKYGAEINVTNTYGYSQPLFFATASGCYEAVKLFLKHGAYVHAQTATDGRYVGTAYNLAITINRPDIANLLRNIEDFVYMNFSSKKYDSALLIFYSSDKDSREVMLYKTLTEKKYQRTLWSVYSAFKRADKEKELSELLKCCEDENLKDLQLTYDIQNKLGNFSENKELLDVNINYLN